MIVGSSLSWYPLRDGVFCSALSSAWRGRNAFVLGQEPFDSTAISKKVCSYSMVSLKVILEGDSRLYKVVLVIVTKFSCPAAVGV